MPFRRRAKFSGSAIPHVLYIIDHLDGLGGGEAALTRTVRLMPPDRIRCSVVTLNPKVHPEVRAQLRCPIYVLPLTRTHDLNALSMAIKLRGLIRSGNVDVVHTFFETANLWGGVVTKLGGGPLLVSSRRDLGILRTGRKHRLGYKVINRLCDRILAVSGGVRDFCVEHDGVSPHKVSIVYNGVELSWLDAIAPDDQLRTKFGFAPGTQIVTSVGHMRPEKGTDIVIEAAAQVLRRQPDCRFLIVGADNDLQFAAQMRARVHTLGLEKKIVFVGLTRDVIPILKSSNIFCLLSRTEGFSNAILEAMACKLPCVVTNVGGNAEAVENGVTGFVVPSEDVESAADSILALLNDSVGAAKMGESARKRVEMKFSSEQMISALIEFYESLCSKAGATV